MKCTGCNTEMTPEEFLKLWHPQSASEFVAYDMLQQLIDANKDAEARVAEYSRVYMQENEAHNRLLRTLRYRGYSQHHFRASNTIIRIETQLDKHTGLCIQAVELKNGIQVMIPEISQGEAVSFNTK